MKKFWNRFFVLLMTLVMALSAFNVAAMAEETADYTIGNGEKLVIYCTLSSQAASKSNSLNEHPAILEMCLHS